MIAPLVSGTVGETIGYRWGFLTAGIAMLVGLVQYRLTGGYLGDAGLVPQGTSAAERRRSARLLLGGLALLTAVVGVFASGAVEARADVLAGWFNYFMVAIAVAFFLGVLLFGGLAIWPSPEWASRSRSRCPGRQ